MWIDCGGGHRVQPIATEQPGVVTILWEHDTLPGYVVPRHMISSATGARWTLVRREPLTLSPSIHCDPGRGGCGMHGFITDGLYR